MPLNKDSVFEAYDASFGNKILEVLETPYTDLKLKKDAIIQVFTEWVTAPREKMRTVTINPDTTTIATDAVTPTTTNE